MAVDPEDVVGPEADLAAEDSESLDVLIRAEDAAEDIDGDEDEYEGKAFLIKELPLDELDEDLENLPLPVQPDEFTCNRCFLVLHHSQQFKKNGKNAGYCLDCA